MWGGGGSGIPRGRDKGRNEGRKSLSFVTSSSASHVQQNWLRSSRTVQPLSVRLREMMGIYGILRASQLPWLREMMAWASC